LDFDEYADNFGMVPFRINLGRKDGVGLVDVIRFIERKTGIIEHLIGNVEVGEESSKLEIHKSVAFRAMKGLENYSMHGKKIRIDIVRDRATR
jgi:hypothetical protein